MSASVDPLLDNSTASVISSSGVVPLSGAMFMSTVLFILVSHQHVNSLGDGPENTLHQINHKSAHFYKSNY
jgi:hypothetical protein